MPRLRELFGAQFLAAEYPVRDVLQRVVFYFDEHPEIVPPPNMKQTTVCEFFGMDVSRAHDALDDARLCAELYHRLVRAEKRNEVPA
jgi:DNA polymerase III epsilon subunit-like protein